MPTRRHVSLLVLAGLALASGCAGGDDAASGDAGTGSAATTAPADTLPAPVDPDALWAAEVIEAWDALLAENEAAITEYLDGFEGYTTEEVTAYRYLVSHPLIADAVAAFPDTPTDPELVELYDALVAALATELDAGSEAAAQIDANLELYQAAAEDGGHDEYAQLRGTIALARDSATLACLDLATAFADRDLGTLDCIEGPMEDAGSGADPGEGAPPAEFEGDELTIVMTSDHDSDLPEGTFIVTNGDDALGCLSGTWTDVELNDDGTELTTELVCATGNRAGTMVMLQHYKADEWWEFTGGDDEFTGLTGGGTTADLDIGEATTTVTLTGHGMHEHELQAAADAPCESSCPIDVADHALIEASVAAYNAGDWEAWLATVVDDEPTFILPFGEQTAEQIEYDFIWSAAMNDVWTLGDCIDIRGDIHCPVTIEDDLHRALSDLGLEPSECNLVVGIVDDLVDWRRYDLHPCHTAYDQAMHAFGAWFHTNYPDEARIDGPHYRGWNQTDTTAGVRAQDHLQAWLDSGEAGLGEHHH